jgi:hypothetical protein
VVYQSDRDGFYCYALQSAAAGSAVYWNGSFAAIA